ncbi:MAG: hypothetical protein VX346_08380 [Planctomycetota bacterium]|nr:hypothetical protein [Planctomycetota bacterium]
MSRTRHQPQRLFSHAVMRAWLGTLLSLISLSVFWVIPFSPILAIAAIRLNPTEGTWSRRLALLAGWLCTLYTTALAIWMLLAYTASSLAAVP